MKRDRLCGHSIKSHFYDTLTSKRCPSRACDSPSPNYAIALSHRGERGEALVTCNGFFTRTLLSSVEIPAVIQQTNLPNVLLLVRAHQLIAQPLRHLRRPPPGPYCMNSIWAGAGRCAGPKRFHSREFAFFLQNDKRTAPS